MTRRNPPNQMLAAPLALPVTNAESVQSLVCIRRWGGHIPVDWPMSIDPRDIDWIGIDRMNDLLERNFTYHAPKDGQPSKYEPS